MAKHVEIAGNAASHYTEDGGAGYHSKRVPPERTLAWIYRNRARKFRPYVSSDDVVFEYGCGSGWNLAQLECKRKLAHDISPLLRPEIEALGIEWAAPGEIEPSSVDVVISHHALEHIAAPVDCLAAIHRILKPGGRLVLVVPFEGARRGYDPRDKERHLYCWTPQTLGNLVTIHGFDLIEAPKVKLTGYERFAAAGTSKLGQTAYNAFLSLLRRVRPELELIVSATPRKQAA